MSGLGTTLLFGNFRIATASGGRGGYKHTFGGAHDRKGASRDDCNGILIHLLHRLDLTDPCIPFVIPGIRWMPFYYCFDFRANDLGYQLLSDDEMVTFFPSDDTRVSKEESWPGDNYPLKFPTRSIRVKAQNYDPTYLEDAYQWSGIFGIDKLSKPDRSEARQRVNEERTGLGLPVAKTKTEFNEALSNPFLQGKPDSMCLNPKCSNRKKKGSLSTIALMPAEPVKGVHTFGRWGSGVELIFQLCPECYTIRVSNQCD